MLLFGCVHRGTDTIFCGDISNGGSKQDDISNGVADVGSQERRTGTG